MSIGGRLKHAWNSFMTNDDTAAVGHPGSYVVQGPSSSTRPDRLRPRFANERTIISSIYTRLSVDVAGVRIEHVRIDKDTDQYVETIDSDLNNCFKIEANLDQGARHFRQDIASSLFQWGCIAVVPVDTTLNPLVTGSWDVKTVRVGEILHWWPEKVRVRAYNEKSGQHEDITLPKSMVAIIENPFYSVMNEPNSTLQRLVHKLSLLDNVDEISSSGKLDIIIQLPYTVKTETRRNQAEKRVEDIKDQLQGSTYGIAYADGTEKITQLNRAVENNLLEQVKYLKEELYSELGLTPEIMNGTADDVVMLNYWNRTIEPVMDAITEGITRTFLTKTARTQGHSLMYFQSPFKMLPVSKLAEVVDVLSRNQIIKPNEVRPVLGLKPDPSPQANQLINSNMPLDKQVAGGAPTPPPEEETDIVDGEVIEDPADAEEAALDAKMAELGLG